MQDFIPANELRIGNFHKSETISIPKLQIHSVEVDGQAYAAITGYGIHLVETGELKIEPIEISEAWLEKLGFIKEHKYSYRDPKWVKDGRTYIQFDSGLCRTEWAYNEGIEEHEDEDFGEAITHIHELQNVHFALTGVEL